MVIALLVLVGAVLLLGWLMATVAYVVILVTTIAKVVDRSNSLREDSISAPNRWRAADERFLRDAGIRP
jgi:hypothetical protein